MHPDRIVIGSENKKVKEILKDNHLFDLRNIYSKEIIEKENGFKYFSAGR